MKSFSLSRKSQSCPQVLPTRGSQYLKMPVQTLSALSPFPESVLSPETTLNLKTHPNILWSPAVNHCINGHWGKAPWLKSPPRKRRKDAEAGAEITGSKQNGCKAALGCWLEKGVSSLLPWFHVLPEPQQPLAQAWGSCPLGLPCSPLWVSHSSSSRLTRSWCPLGGQGQLVCYREICSAHRSHRGRGKAALSSL